MMVWKREGHDASQLSYDAAMMMLWNGSDDDPLEA